MFISKMILLFANRKSNQLEIGNQSYLICPKPHKLLNPPKLYKLFRNPPATTSSFDPAV
jgi:hypothetical protein